MLSASLLDARGVLRFLLPLFDRRAIEAPLRADAKTGQLPCAKQSVNRGWVHAKVIGEFLHRHDFLHDYHPRRYGAAL